MNRCPECELSLSDGVCLMCGYSDPIPSMRAKIEQLQATILRYEEREASCCPEDVGCDEFIAQLQATISQLHAIIEAHWTKQAGGHLCACDAWPECIHTLAACEMRSAAMKFDSPALAISPAPTDKQ
jgi:hypothetical protein